MTGVQNDIPKTGTNGYKQIAGSPKKMKTHFLAALVVTCLLSASMFPASGAANDPINNALPAAKAWLALIDAGKYDESYDIAGQGLYQKVSNKREWETALKIIRGAWGSVLSRKESQHLYQPNGIVGLNGECMAIAFDTNTEKQGGMVEMVIMRFEDGKWRGVGYTMGAKAAQTPEGAPAAVSTTTSNVYPNNAKPVGPASTPAKSH